MITGTYFRIDKLCFTYYRPVFTVSSVHGGQHGYFDFTLLVCRDTTPLRTGDLFETRLPINKNIPYYNSFVILRLTCIQTFGPPPLTFAKYMMSLIYFFCDLLKMNELGPTVKYSATFT